MSLKLEAPSRTTVEALEFSSASLAGRREHNDDACATCVPGGVELRYRGALAAVADGVASAEAGGAAARAAVSGFLSDYYSTPETWTIKQAAARVLQSLNGWLHRQGGGGEIAQGWLTTFSAVIFKGASAHLIHIGDSRIHRLRDGRLECLTRDHSRALGPGRTFLSRALGMDAHVEVDYRREPLHPGDIYLLTSDGVHEHLPPATMAEILQRGDDDPARALVDAALAAGSGDNLSAAVCRVERVAQPEGDDLLAHNRQLPFPPDLSPGNKLDGYLILQELQASPRSQLYLARDTETGSLCAIKTPSVNFADDPAYIESFIAEEWTGRRLDHPGIIRIHPPKPERQFLYHVMEAIDGQNLRQWMQLNPRPELEQVRDFIGQLVSALRRLQRMEIIHGDLKPENIMLTRDGRLKLIDLGGASAAGLAEHLRFRDGTPPGSKNYAAPEYFFGDSPSHRSDIFSLGVITYELLTGHYPYRERFGSRHYQLKSYAGMQYTSARQHRADIPEWIDGALQKACAPDPRYRYPALSEFVHDLHTPNAEFAAGEDRPLMERNPLLFWQLVALLLLLSHLLHLL
ncbi:bifunctional protein-serine/threonine kinase/phosphatase [Microbulbifer rhizosphaerae]|uniref:Serine/threonine protein phosphatase PrpC n=1 Tax=Microbulbifer rhizosphaerae TaxID=1562603 RepID=A0A7W4W8L8_9GAMM|nr:bifunctional protein-serine/threonine kinase/phosphatase [Microbulbifer rhizosphaerae]MBB3059658.1 serine/threonine protein phosphatase PrpC [Microbulbifer rhizosphaerae]